PGTPGRRPAPWPWSGTAGSTPAWPGRTACSVRPAPSSLDLHSFTHRSPAAYGVGRRCPGDPAHFPSECVPIHRGTLGPVSIEEAVSEIAGVTKQAGLAAPRGA